MLHFGVGTAATGAATASSATVSAGIAATAGAGAATEEMWGKMRDSSWKGIQEMYEKGEISEEQIEVFAAIRNLNDEEWTQIKKDYLSGNIGKEEFEAIKQIKEMPEDWTTLENGIKGIFYGISTGAWEGLQWYFGGKLANWSYPGSKAITSATRIGADTAFNALDTPYRTILESIATGDTLAETWEGRGGVNAMLVDIGIGLIGSTGGEVFDGVKSKISYTKEVKQAKEVLTKVDSSGRLVELYNEGIKTGSEYLTFLTYEEHNFAHVTRVAERSKATLNALYKLIDSGEIEGLKKIDNRIVYLAALSHDLGMGHPVIDKNFKKFEGNIPKTREGGFNIRKGHSNSSAAIVLEFSDVFKEDTEIISAVACIHSKSSSGVLDIFNDAEISDMIEKLYNSTKERRIQI